MTKTDASGNRTRRIHNRYCLLRDLLKEDKIVLEYCPTSDILAEIFTNLLTLVLFQKVRIEIRPRIKWHPAAV